MHAETGRTLDEIASRLTADAELADLARRVREGVGRLNWRMRAEADKTSPGPALLAVLSRLYRAGTQTPTELAEAERLQPQSLTRILAALTIRGLIEREPDPDDGRRSRISINDDGLAVLREYSAQRERWLAAAVESTLSPTERQLLRLAADLLIRVADA
ncbi:MarR family winged helix-turn-helix transcriptional regulator [Amycolatopsis rifamycinica]|uniref:MarR family transcriptional regulator n=1 Tax=Amycolatopsis rifamycinica TaxID=287986 RepID=A0A066UAB0_9PSEU|nr:MarR family transcriptional regulator [Amycolatopsis rifamycinica]KDN21148.1 MarR family transcriptional regulator [Amycolatopsis rifamycinica]